MAKLYDDLVPAVGMTNNLFGEVIRAASRLTYEYGNNGNCNAHEFEEVEEIWVECPHCGGSGYCDDDDCECPECGGEGGYYEEGEEGEVSIIPFYADFIRLIQEFFEEYLPEARVIMDKVENVILTGRCRFDDEEMHPYTLMTDAVIYIIKSKLSTLEQAAELSPEIPQWYKDEHKY